MARLEIVFPAVILLVGPAASGKTTLRRRLIASCGIDPTLVVSLDDTRLWLRQRSLASGRPGRALTDYTPAALRIAASQCRTLLAAGGGYVVDNTNLRRPERKAHADAAREAGLAAIALLTPVVTLDTLRRRNGRRAAELRVPERILAAQHRRRQSLGPDRLLDDEGFAGAWVVDEATTLRLRPVDQPG